MKYQNKREKIKEIFDCRILPELKKDYWKPLDYYKTIGLVSSLSGSSDDEVEKVIKSLILAGILVEERNLVLSQDQIDELKKQFAESIDKDLNEVGLK